MKKSILTCLAVALCLLSGAPALAQSIQLGDRFFDGSTLFQVQDIRMGTIVYMTDVSGEEELTLECVAGKAGEYTLQPSRQAEEPRYGASFGGRVRFVSQPDNAYLEVYGEGGRVVRTLPLIRPEADLAPGSRWYDGALVYEASPLEDCAFLMNAMAEGEELEFMLMTVDEGTDFFTVADGPHDALNAFSGTAYARRIRQDGLDVICFYDSENRLSRVMQATSEEDSQKLNIAQWMAQLCGSYLMRDPYAEVQLEAGRAVVDGVIVPLEVTTFNGMVLRILDFGKTGTVLMGQMEAEPTRDGLRLYDVAWSEENYFFERKGHFYEMDHILDTKRFAFASSILLNGPLTFYDKPTLRLMRNAILAGHGYVFQSKDLKNYFGKQPWYKPGSDNAAIRLSLLEQLNISLIQAAERAE